MNRAEMSISVGMPMSVAISSEEDCKLEEEPPAAKKRRGPGYNATPPNIGYTNFPKETLSYRWFISNAKAFLKRGNCELGIRSPSFSVSLPANHNGGKQTSTWYLRMCDNKGVFTSRNRIPSMGDNTMMLYLCQKSFSDVRFRPAFSKMWLFDVAFSVLGQKVYMVKHSVTAPYRECSVGCDMDDFGVNFIKKSKAEELVQNDTLVIQVKANIVFFDNPIEKLNKGSIVPPNNALDRMKSLLEDKLFADVTIKCGDEKHEAHKAILASQSPVFKRMFEVDMSEKSSNIVEVSDIDPPVMSDLLAYLYTGTAPNMNMLARELLNAANKYDLRRLFIMCENELMVNVNIDNVIEELLHAEIHQASNLKKVCLDLIKSNSMEIYKSDAWKDLRSNSAHKDLVFEVLEY